jgi:uncharacterized protein YjbI with pentapeptide repeats
LSQIELRDCEHELVIDGANLGNSALRDVSLAGSNFENVGYENSTFLNVTLENSALEYVRFDGCKMKYVSFREVSLTILDCDGMIIDGIPVRDLVESYRSAHPDAPPSLTPNAFSGPEANT